MDQIPLYAEVLLPLPVSTFTYVIPEGLAEKTVEGVRVVVQFGKRKIYTALVVELHNRKPEGREVKEILSVLDEFRNPRHEEFKDRTRWSLLNAFTETAKKYSPPRFDLCQRKLSELFQLDR